MPIQDKSILLLDGVPSLATFNQFRTPAAEVTPVVIDSRTGIPYYHRRNVGFVPFGGLAYAPLSTGVEPLELVSDGAGQCVMVPYRP